MSSSNGKVQLQAEMIDLLQKQYFPSGVIQKQNFY